LTPPPASIIAIELKKALPARSNQLTGNTTDSSLANADIFLMVGLSSTDVARSRCLKSCSMQK